ncbi:hypothetical protein SISSUDRAFT_817763 [Sistotremastrum suecicum HHB10207 ss-3]|uniref:Uncharacterized protein n=1 Tax=Sistotremastrum suecicum HHB10207 ss-3 TaxID=1314776 RepID=A0A166CVC6_9AGAM|nr:hypothetical protein SISSUDRAFT_817763 [Sistotremastrum suecicum HHB10207 ss-3]
MDFRRRSAVKREPESGEKSMRTMNFVIYPTLLGIKGAFPWWLRIGNVSLTPFVVVNLVTNKVSESRLFRKDETDRWLDLSLCQGAPAKQGMSNLHLRLLATPCSPKERPRSHSRLHRLHRLTILNDHYVGIEDAKGGGDCDVFNGRPTQDEQKIALGTTCQGHWSRVYRIFRCNPYNVGRYTLFPDQGPKAVNNFCWTCTILIFRRSYLPLCHSEIHNKYRRPSR